MVGRVEEEDIVLLEAEEDDLLKLRIRCWSVVDSGPGKRCCEWVLHVVHGKGIMNGFPSSITTCNRGPNTVD